MRQDRTYLSAAETAKLLRKALKADFPGVKFSVRSKTYAGGASITVGWLDGPLASDVDRTLALYSGASFDGMIDLKSYHDSLLMTDDGPQVVHFGADFVHSSRRISDARHLLYARELRRFVEGLGVEWKGAGHSTHYPVSVVTGDFYPLPGSAELAADPHAVARGSLSHDSHRGEYATTIVGQMAHSRRWLGVRCPGGEGSYCPGCGRWQGDHRGPHLA